jgi:hypothetical protein
MKRQQVVLLVLATLVLPLRVASAELTYLVCTYVEPAEIRDLRAASSTPTPGFTLAIDFAGRRLSLFRQDEETKYMITSQNDRELAAAPETSGSGSLTLNRLTGEFQEAIPVPKSSNKDLWNHKENKKGFPEDVQLTMTLQGTCRVEQPKF